MHPDAEPAGTAKHPESCRLTRRQLQLVARGQPFHQARRGEEAVAIAPQRLGGEALVELPLAGGGEDREQELGRHGSILPPETPTRKVARPAGLGLT